MRFFGLVGTYEIAQMLGVSRQRVDQLAQTEGFPAPIAHLHMGRIWLSKDVTRWMEATGRSGR